MGGVNTNYINNITTPEVGQTSRESHYNSSVMSNFFISVYKA